MTRAVPRGTSAPIRPHKERRAAPIWPHEPDLKEREKLRQETSGIFDGCPVSPSLLVNKRLFYKVITRDRSLCFAERLHCCPWAALLKFQAVFYRDNYRDTD